MTLKSFAFLIILFKIKKITILAYSPKKKNINAAVNDKIIVTAKTSRTDIIVGKYNILNLEE
jgi:hypothetical protein